MYDCIIGESWQSKTRQTYLRAYNNVCTWTLNPASGLGTQNFLIFYSYIYIVIYPSFSFYSFLSFIMMAAWRIYINFTPVNCDVNDKVDHDLTVSRYIGFDNEWFEKCLSKFMYSGNIQEKISFFKVKLCQKFK